MHDLVVIAGFGNEALVAVGPEQRQVVFVVLDLVVNEVVVGQEPSPQSNPLLLPQEISLASSLAWCVCVCWSVVSKMVWEGVCLSVVCEMLE